MLKLAERQLLAVLLCVLMANPPSIVAASTPSASRAVLGSIAASGSVRVGEILVPAQGTLFSGDRVNTNSGSATIQYRDGARVQLASESLADFAPSRVQLEKGLMTFQTVSSNGIVFAASTLRLEPTTAKASANVTMKDTKASVSVTEGSVKVVDPSGVLLASLNAGDARLFEESPSSSPADPAASPSAAAAAPQTGSNGGNGWKWAVAIGVLGVSLAIAALVRANDASNSDKNDAADAAGLAAQTLAAQLQTQLTALQASVAGLQGVVNADAATSAALKSITQQIDQQLQALATAQQQFASGAINLTTYNAMITTIGSTLTSLNGQLGNLNFVGKTST